jgi:hypothetical protein
MPYIKQEDRYNEEEENAMRALVARLQSADAGHINYVFSTIVWTLFERQKNYQRANDLLGVLEAVKLEFYRRKVAPYENLKQAANGDVSTL